MSERVWEARDRVLDAMPNDCTKVIEIACRDVDELIAAVSADRDAAWRNAVEAVRKPTLCAADCVCGMTADDRARTIGWNAALDQLIASFELSYGIHLASVAVNTDLAWRHR